MGVDATTLEANAAMKSIVRRDTGEDWQEYVRRLMQEAGQIEPGDEPSAEEIARFDRNRKDKKVSNQEWQSKTDPDSRIMKGPDGFVQAYNTQIAVDELQLIVGQAVTQETNDKRQLLPMIATIKKQSGHTPAQLLADAGYCSDENLQAMAKTRIDTYISTRKQKHGERPGPCPRGPLPTTATRVDRMSRKLHRKVGAAVYAARKAMVEPVFGQIKQARGFRQFLLRGLEKVQAEWSLVCTTHNILKLYRLCG